eukprot:CAMPEP_0173397732 /NCGR_PEP_ID=MMETSP1356-20130122/39353_1 /TAXON_ID=77927 ORGANISM="Hemiselmis virescens, Strain PCC157" /NCGR_SAMPLE_ID=MMETSP1356 /ASSEMBLY_ACC=CAM_ASM_000847 /LENGTH=209 /DNA_ID=CAMNT_0014357059 /DNA_START=161 /DNA_END=786 /DNA_ORIENTATION=-
MATGGTRLMDPSPFAAGFGGGEARRTTDQCVNTVRSPFDARSFFNSPLYSDIKVTFSCDGDKTTIYAHRMALHQSSYFEKAMDSSWAESGNAHLIIDGVRPDVGQAIVAFLYGADLEVPQNQLLPLLTTIDRLMMSDLEDVCSDHIHALLRPQNVLEIAAGIAEGCPSMHRAWLSICSAFIADNEEAIRRTDAFRSISRDAMMLMIAVR